MTRRLQQGALQVRTHRITATLVALACVAASATRSDAQVAPAGPRPTVPSPGAPVVGATAPRSTHHGIAVIDVTFILEHYSRLKQAMEVYKKDAQDAEDALKKEREAIGKRAERIKTLKPGTPDFKAEEEAITKAESDWKLKVAAQRRDFAERESKNYLRAYQELTATVKEFADRNGIVLVLRFNGAPIDPNNREMVQMEVFKMVMHYDKSIDITDPVLAELNRKAAIAAPRTPQRR
jgi:Skp family chaperone for outer membrane proteins